MKEKKKRIRIAVVLLLICAALMGCSERVRNIVNSLFDIPENWAPETYSYQDGVFRLETAYLQR